MTSQETTSKIFLGPLDHDNTYDANPTGTVTFGGVSYNITDFVYDTSIRCGHNYSSCNSRISRG